MKITELVTLMEAEANRMESQNEHSAAILLRAGAEAIRSHGIVTPVNPSAAFVDAVLREIDSRKARGL